jgi:hypothetical protein
MPEVGDVHLHAQNLPDLILQHSTHGCFSRCLSCGSGVKSEVFSACLECRELFQDVKPGDSAKAPLLVDSSVWPSANDIPQAPVAVGNHVPVPFTPARVTRPRSSSSDDSLVRSPSPTSPYRTQYSQRGRPPNGSRQGPKGFKGVRQRKGVRGYLVEIRPPKWKRTIWLGTYSTDREAAGAYDAGIFYTHKKTRYNFPDLQGTFPPLPSQLRLDNADDSEEIKTFVQKEARVAAQKVKELPAATTAVTSAAAPPAAEEIQVTPGIPFGIPFDDEYWPELDDSDEWQLLVDDMMSSSIVAQQQPSAASSIWSFIPKQEERFDPLN